MNEERKKVLEMLAVGKITAEQAEKLLDKLAGSAAGPQAPTNEAQGIGSAPVGKANYLRIVVESPASSDQVNMRVPLSLVGTGRRLMAVMPAKVTQKLSEYGIDSAIFASENCQNLEQVIRELNVDVEHGNGKKVRIYCE
jgi:hypothetical protein